MSKSKKTYIFTLKCLDTPGIITKYNIGTIHIPEQKNITSIDSYVLRQVSFLDEAKRVHKCNVSMIDFTTNTAVNKLKYHCFWDRHEFNTTPLGIPITYVSKNVVKTYMSEISKDVRSIKGYITDETEINTPDDVFINTNDFYQTDGVVCSWNCMSSFINDNKNDPKYNGSRMLMYKMYKDITGNVLTVRSAPHWKQLVEYGGWSSIDEFRDNFDKIDYEYHGTIKYFPTMKSNGHIWEEKFRL